MASNNNNNNPQGQQHLIRQLIYWDKNRQVKKITVAAQIKEQHDLLPPSLPPRLIISFDNNDDDGFHNPVSKFYSTW
ncbi:MAG: hypothetical protein ACJ71I_08720 [Nitrososphaeraceae archaeon]